MECKHFPRLEAGFQYQEKELIFWFLMIQSLRVMSHQSLSWGKKKTRRTKFEERENAWKGSLNREEMGFPPPSPHPWLKESWKEVSK